MLGHGARRLHVSAAYRAKANVSMSRFEPTSFVNYERMQSNVDIVRKRSVALYLWRVTRAFPPTHSQHMLCNCPLAHFYFPHPRLTFTFDRLNLSHRVKKKTKKKNLLKLLFFRAAPESSAVKVMFFFSLFHPLISGLHWHKHK